MIDFVIPCHPKDFPSLKLCVKGIGNISCAGRIFIVSMEDPGIKRNNSYPRKDTSSILIKKKLLRSSLLMLHIFCIEQNGISAVQLYAFKVIPELSDSYVLVDSDTIFLRDIPFDSDKFFFCKAEEYHKPYLEPIKKLFGIEKTIGFSAISHHMIFNKEKMAEMHSTTIENRFECESLFEIIISILDYTEILYE